jgi:hypothetical protein
MLAMMEIPAILIGISLARINAPSNVGSEQVPLREIARELLAGKSSLLLIGFLVIGFLVGDTGWDQVAPLFDVPFKGVLTIFLLEAGLVAGRKLEKGAFF